MEQLVEYGADVHVTRAYVNNYSIERVPDSVDGQRDVHAASDQGRHRAACHWIWRGSRSETQGCRSSAHSHRRVLFSALGLEDASSINELGRQIGRDKGNVKRDLDVLVLVNLVAFESTVARSSRRRTLNDRCLALLER